MSAQTSFLDTLFCAQVAVTAPDLPEGWTTEDIKHLLEKLDKGPILVSDTHLGIPTIHDNFGVEIDHAGFGLMVGKGNGFKLSFDAGGAMNRTPSGKGWTYLHIEGECPYMYDTEAVRCTLQSYLPPEPGTLAHQVETIMAKATPAPVQTPDDFWGEPISSYSRAEALSDGELVDVSEMAKEAGWKYPVAITAALAGACTPTEDEEALGQSFAGRLWDVLWMAFLAAKQSKGADTIRFRVIIAEASPDAEDGVKHIEHELYAVCGPGDTMEPVITIGFPLDF